MGFTYTKNTDGKFTCPHCTYTAKHQSTMHYHLKKHEGSLPHQCKHCSMRFIQKALLDLHVQSRHPESTEPTKQAYKCPCEGCAYEDIRKGNRLIHFIRVHLKSLVESLRKKSCQEGCVAQCTACNQSFKSMTQFYYHASSCVMLEETSPMFQNWTTVRA